MKKILYIDMDGVLCDYDKAKDQALLESPEIIYPQSQVGFYRDLKPIKHAIVSVEMLSTGFDIYFLSAPSYKNPMSYTEKMLWIKQYFGEWGVKRLILSKHKYLNKGDYLIDDRPDHGDNNKFEGELIHFGSEQYPNWLSILQKFNNE